MENYKWPYEEEPEEEDLIGTLFWGDPDPDDIKQTKEKENYEDEDTDQEWWESDEPV